MSKELPKDGNFQRLGAISNAHAGNDFESKAAAFFAGQGVHLTKNHAVEVGVGSLKKSHRFDLGSKHPPIIVECKSHTWTSGGNTPSAKMTVWNEAMYYFHVAPPEYRKVLFVLKHHRRELTLASYYLKTHGHLVPSDVEIYEYDEQSNSANRIK